MANARHHRSHPNGERQQMTPAWKQAVREALEMRDVGEQWLADQITIRRALKKPMKRDTINKMLRRQKGSSLVPDVCAILGLQPPMIATPPTPDEDTKRALSLMLNAPPEVRRAILLLLEERSKPG
jgi:hypothetical protein